MDKQNVIYTYNVIYTKIWVLFSYKNEWNPDTCYNMDDLWRHYAKWNKPVRKGQILYASTYVSYLEYKNS